MREFTTSRGVRLEFLPIPTLLEKLQVQHPMPAPPTYEVKTATGAVELHQHDETTLDTDADKAAWAEYQVRLKAATDRLNLALMRLVLLRGLKVDMPAPNGWVHEQQFIGIQVPDDPLELKLHWLQTEALASQEDYLQAVAGVMEASGVPEEVISQAEATFRGKVERQTAGGLAAEKDRQELDNEQPVRAGAGRGQKRHSRH